MPVLPPASGAEISIVLLGSFNPAIFHPEWFLRQHLLEEDEVDQAVCNLLTPDVADISFFDFGVQVVMNRIVVKTSDATVSPKILDLVSALLMKLPHMPITAVGLNSSFHLPLNNAEEWHLIGHTLAPKQPVWDNLYKKPGMTSVGIRAPREGEYPGVINILVQPSVNSVNSIFIHSNHEYKPEGEESAAKAIGFMQSSAGLALKEANRVAEVIFEEIVWKPRS